MALIAIIEDNPDNLELMTYLLKAFGYTVQTATDGEEGLKAAYREVPDLIICDMQLPGMSGYEVAKHLKGDFVLAARPLIAVTALAMVGDRDRILASGFDGYIAKPINPETFVQEVERFLRSDQGALRFPSVLLPVTSALASSPPFRATVLVVDNMSVNRQLLRSTLEPFGYETILAGGIHEALTLARQRPPDLILSDLHLSNESGLDLIKAVRADPQLTRIPFLFITATVWGVQDPKIALALGANGFILRPIEPEALLKEIESVLKK